MTDIGAPSGRSAEPLGRPTSRRAPELPRADLCVASWQCGLRSSQAQ